eukprot:455599_1
MFRLCEEEQLTGIRLYQLITKNNQNERNIMQFIQRISNQFSLSSYPLSQQMQNEIKLWAQRTLQSAKMWLAPPCKRSQPSYHLYDAHIEQKKDQSVTEEDMCHDILDLDRSGALLRGVYQG